MSTLLDAARRWIARMGNELRSLPIIRALWDEIAEPVTRPARQNEALDYFLNGDSIARAAARLWPGHNGPMIVIEQRQLENAAREHILYLEERLAQLQQTAAQATGHAAMRAKALDGEIARLQDEKRQLEEENKELKASIAELKSALARALAALQASKGAEVAA